MGYDFVIILVLLLSKGRCKAVIYVRCNDKAILSAFDHDISSLFDSFSLASVMLNDVRFRLYRNISSIKFKLEYGSSLNIRIYLR